MCLLQIVKQTRFKKEILNMCQYNRPLVKIASVKISGLKKMNSRNRMLMSIFSDT